MNVFDKVREEEREDAAPPEAEGQEFDDESPEYMRAKELMLSKLYEEGAAQGLAEALKTASSPVQGIVQQAMNLVDVMEQVTQGSVPDEEVMSFVMEILQEVIEIAQASGISVRNADIAAAVSEVLAQVVENLGGDASAIREEMGSIDPEEIGAQLDAEEA